MQPAVAVETHAEKANAAIPIHADPDVLGYEAAHETNCVSFYFGCMFGCRAKSGTSSKTPDARCLLGTIPSSFGSQIPGGLHNLAKGLTDFGFHGNLLFVIFHVILMGP
jgi:hypothetical protein